MVQESTLNIEGTTFPCTGHENRQHFFQTDASESYQHFSVSKFTLDKRTLSCYIITMRTVMISPTNKASKRTKNRIRENGPTFQVMRENTQHVFAIGCVAGSLMRSKNGWLGWLPRSEFHVECVGKKFIEKVLG